MKKTIKLKIDKRKVRKKVLIIIMNITNNEINVLEFIQSVEECICENVYFLFKYKFI